MSPRLASLAKRVLLEAGHYRRRLRQETFPGVAVLGYHGVRADEAPAGVMPFDDNGRLGSAPLSNNDFTNSFSLVAMAENRIGIPLES